MDDIGCAEQLLVAARTRACERRPGLVHTDDAIAAIAAALSAPPKGWRLRRDGAGIVVTAPEGVPGGMTVRGSGRTLQERLLYALCNALLSAGSCGGDDAR